MARSGRAAESASGQIGEDAPGFDSLARQRRTSDLASEPQVIESAFQRAYEGLDATQALVMATGQTPLPDTDSRK